MPTPDESDTEPLVERVAARIEGAVRSAVGTTARHLDEMPGARVRRLRRMARNPLPFLYDVWPEARYANPRDLGTMTIDVAEIAGTAVGPARQRGMDFLPMKPLRTLNWRGRWQRIRNASDRLAILPPIDVVRYGGRYWVVDGHNRVAVALYSGQLGIDTNVIDLDASDGTPADRSGSLAAQFQEHDEIRAALSRRTLGDPPGEASAGDADERS